jgi:hypothetical protein
MVNRVFPVAPGVVVKNVEVNKPIAQVGFSYVTSTPSCELAFDRIKKLAVGAVVVQKAIKLAANHGNRIGCATTTIFSALGSLYAGNFISAALYGFMSLKELHNIFAPYQNTDFNRIIDNADSDVGMIKMLTDSNQESCKILHQQLKTIDSHVVDLERRLVEIKSLAIKGNKEVEKCIEQAIYSNLQASKFFRKAKDELKIGFEQQAVVVKALENVIHSARDMVRTAQESSLNVQAKADEFVQHAQAMQKQSEKAQQQAIMVQTHIVKGQELLQHAVAWKQDALLGYGRAVGEAKSALRLIEDMSKQTDANKQKYQKAMQACHQEVHALENRARDTHQILEGLHIELMAAKENQGVAISSIVYGGVPGALLGGCLLGAMGMVTLLFLGIAAVEKRKTIASAAEKASHFVHGTSPEKIEECVTSDQAPVGYVYDNQSSGWWGRYIEKRKSTTVGTVFIKIGKDVQHMPFNLNDEDHIAKFDLLVLIRELHKKVVEGIIEPKQCLHVIHQLETMQIKRKPRQVVEQGFVKANNPYLNAIKDLCNSTEMLHRHRQLSKSV